MKRKLPIILVASSAIMLAASTIGSTKATLTYMSDNYLAQIDIKSIGVTLTENGNDVSCVTISIRMMTGARQQECCLEIC